MTHRAFGFTLISGQADGGRHRYADPVSVTPMVNGTEIWRIANLTAGTHPPSTCTWNSN